MSRRHLKQSQILVFWIFLLIGICIPEENCAQYSLPPDYWSVELEGKETSIEDLLSIYLQIPSVSGQEMAAGEFLLTVCVENGLFIKQLGSEQGNYNFAASLYPLEEGKPNIILLNHMDVVPAGSGSKWEQPPFHGKIVDGEIWGRGALDMKGVAVAQLVSLLKFKSDYLNNSSDFNITFLAVSAEEIISDNGASHVTDTYIDILNPAVVFCEGPSGMKGIVQTDKDQEVFGISVVDKKPLWIKLQLAHSSFAHSASCPEHYPAKDLTLALSRLLSAKRDFVYNETNVGMLKGLGKLERGITGFVMKYPRLFKPLISMKIRKDSRMMIFFSNSITLVDYKTVSHSSNSLPQCLECRLDCRLMPEENIEDFIRSIEKTIDNPDIKVIISDSLSGTIPSSLDNVYYSTYQEAIKKSFPSCEVIPALLPGFSDCIHFRLKGIPAYGSNPFPLSEDLLSTMHNFNERIPITALNVGAEIYYNFLIGITKNKGQ